jgi:predicted nucleic acid-binding protein
MRDSQKIRIVIDTNVIFMAWYNPEGKCARILRSAEEGNLELYAPDSVKEEIIRVFKRRNLSDEDINEFLEDFEINWVDENIYNRFLHETKVKHKPDKPVEAVALALNCGILSADKHFRDRIDIDKLIKKL